MAVHSTPYFRARDELSGLVERGVGALPRGPPAGRGEGRRRGGGGGGPAAVLPLREQGRAGRARHPPHGAVLRRQLHGAVVRRRGRQDIQDEQRQGRSPTHTLLKMGSSLFERRTTMTYVDPIAHQTDHFNLKYADMKSTDRKNLHPSKTGQLCVQYQGIFLSFLLTYYIWLA